jgi:hypothetical protein
MSSSTASPVPDKDSASSSQSSSTDYGPPRPGANIIAWARRNQNAPPCRPPPDPTPKCERIGHGGPTRIVSTKDGVLTEYDKKLEQERLAKLAASEDDAQVQLLKETYIFNTGRLTDL